MAAPTWLDHMGNQREHALLNVVLARSRTYKARH